MLEQQVPSMIIGKHWFGCWRQFFRTSPDESSKPIKMLRQWYTEEAQQAALFRHYAQSMQYRQFEKSLANMAMDRSRRSQWIGEKILTLGGQLPELLEQPLTDENSWRSLVMILERESRSAEHIPEQIWRLQSAYPEITQFLQQSYEEEKKSRSEIRRMLMRSDAFALSLV